MQHNRFDVIVVGGGPAGITAAAALGRAGFSVLVCEAAVYPGAENWSGAVYFAENLEKPEAFGLEAIEGGPWERRLVERGFYLYDGHSILGGALRDPRVFRSCYTVLRPVFDRYLAEVSREHGVVLLNETTVQSLIRHDGRVVGVHTERGPAYADVVFLAEGDASHLVTQEGYERVGPERGHGHDAAGGRGDGRDAAGAGDGHGASEAAGQGDGHGGPHFLQGVKEVVSLPPDLLEERFGLSRGEGAAYEMLLRNGTRLNRTVRLNMGGFLYTNRDSVSLGFVLPVDNLARHFDGDHNLLMEWFKGLPEVARWIEGGEVTSYGAKIIRGGGFREIPRLVDDGLAIGGGASGVGLDFPYPNFTGPATGMGLLFARAVEQIAADAGGPGRATAAGRPDRSPFHAKALERGYLKPLRETHYWRNVERLKDWPSYIERTQMFFERQIDVASGAAYILSRPDMSAPRRWWEGIRLKRRVLGWKRLRPALKDMKAMAAGLRLGDAVKRSLGPGTLGRWVVNTVTALIPTGGARTGGDDETGVATAPAPDGGEFRMEFRVRRGEEPAGRMPWLARWYWRRFGPALAGAFADVYTNDDEPLDDKLPRALGRLVGKLSVWDLLVGALMGVAAALTWALQAGVEAFQYWVLQRDLSSFREQLVSRLQEENRRRLRLDDDAVEVVTPYEHKLGTISYREGEHSHIKVLWPDALGERGELAESALWSVCPAKVYEVHRHDRGMPGVVVNFDNCVKCETCWRATPDVHWSRATSQRLIYETYTPTHQELRDYLLGRPEPHPRVRESPAWWDAYWKGNGDRPGEAAPLAAADALLGEPDVGGAGEEDHPDAAARGVEISEALSGVRARMHGFVAGLQAYGEALADAPLALERGERAHLEELLGLAASRFTGARELWDSGTLAAVREALGEPVEEIWNDAADRVADLLAHAERSRYFWSRVVGEQLVDHHVAGLAVLLDALAERLPEPGPVLHGLPEDPRGVWSWAEGWRGVEASRGRADLYRRAVDDWCEEHLHARAVTALEDGEPIPETVREWLSRQVGEALEEGRSGDGRPDPGASAVPAMPSYGPRDVLLEELARRDPSLAVLAASHLQACDLLDLSKPAFPEAASSQGAFPEAASPQDASTEEGSPEAGGPETGATGPGETGEIVRELRSGGRFAALVSQGTVGNRPVARDASRASEPGVSGADGGAVELNGVAPIVPLALADWLLVVKEARGYLVPVDAEGLTIEEPGCIGLIGAGIRRLVFDGCRVPAERVLDLEDAIPVAGARAAARPAAGEPFADLLATAVPDHLSMVRGAGEYLLDRARDHAASRVQFPDTFQDEAGRDTIAKFGAVKRMLAEMEARRVVLESVTLLDPAPAADPWLGAAVRKVLAADAFGPDEGSFSYNTGQVFGGTAYSEDDVIAKYYRDSSPFRFLVAHDDALRVEIGARCLDRVREGGSLIPVSDGEAEWLEALRDQGPLGGVVARWETACELIESRARDLVAEAGDNEAGLHEVRLHGLGQAVVRAVAVKVCILRAAWRLEGGLPSEAVLEATRLLADRWAAEPPALLEQLGLLDETLAVGDETLQSGDFEPTPTIPDAEDYAAVLATDREADSGDWLVRPFDREHLRYVPEILWNDDELREFRVDLEAELRERWVEPSFDGLSYGRWLEKLHIVPQEDIDYLVERGFMRMPIDEELGGEGALKAEYYVLCELMGRYGDAAVSLAIMGNTSIGTTPMIIGLEQDLPRADSELQKVRDDPALLGEIEEGIDEVLAGLARPDLEALQARFLEVADLVRSRIVESSVLKYIGGGFLRAFQAAGQAGERRDLDAFGERLREARELLEEILEGVDERLAEYPRRRRAHEQFLKMISAGYVSAFALTEPTAGSDSGGVKTTAKLASRRVHQDDDGVLYFFLDEDGREERRNLLDADRLEFDFDGDRILYRWSDDAEPAEIHHDEYDYEKDLPGHWRYYRHGDRKVEFTDIGQIRTDADGHPVYEFWELSGAKMWITNGRFAQCFAFYATTEPEGVTGFMVDRHAEGLVVGKDEEKLGQRGSPTNELSLNAARVPRECVIGFPGRGQVNALETLNTGRAGLAVTTRSTLQEMIEDALPYLAGDEGVGRGRRDGLPDDIGVRPLERYWIGRVTEELLTTTAVANELIGLLDHPKTRGVRMESAIGKYYGSEAEHEGIAWMERLRGLDGLTHRHRIEKTRRDARVLNIYEGTNEVQRFLLLRDLAGRVLKAARQSDLDAGERRARALEGVAHPDLVERLEDAKERLLGLLDDADRGFGATVWSNVNLQPVFFRLVEIGGLIKVMDSLLYRLEWVASHDLPDAYRGRLERATRLAFRRAVSRIEALDRRYTAALAYLQDDRYPPAVRLGFLSLDPEAAQAEVWGTMPDRARPVEAPAPLDREVSIAVPLKPVPVVAPEPRLGEETFAEALYQIEPADRRALQAALGLKARDPRRVRVTAYATAGAPGSEILRRALAAGADEATLLEVPDRRQPALHDPTAEAELVRAALDESPADLVLCGDVDVDTGQRSLAPYLAARLGREHVEGVDVVEWRRGRRGEARGEESPGTPDGTLTSDGAPTSEHDPGLRVVADGWQGEALEFELPLVLAFTPPDEHDEVAGDLDSLVRAAGVELSRLRAAGVEGLAALSVIHRRRERREGDGSREIATTPEEAARVLLEVAGLADGAAGAAAEPYRGEILGLGQQERDESASCLFLGEPQPGAEPTGATLESLEATAALARGVAVPLDVLLPMPADVDAAGAVGEILAVSRPRRIFLVEHPDMPRFGWRGHLEWLEEFWGLYRGHAEWLIGPAWATALLARFVGDRPPGVERCYPWFDVEAVSNGGDPVRVASGVFDGAARAEVALPRHEGLRVLTFARNAEVDLGAPVEKFGDSATDAGGREVAVFRHRIQVAYDPHADPVASLLARLGGGELTLSEADFVVDLGYGAGGREGLDELAEPLRRLLVEELGLERTMIGATRKVTQDQEVLPHDRQIGQTGVRVAPKVMVAMAVSGAPQHIDWVDDSTTILAFNIDPEAPLMKLNEQQPVPVVHPIVGDVWETIPRFMEALRERGAPTDED